MTKGASRIENLGGLQRRHLKARALFLHRRVRESCNLTVNRPSPAWNPCGLADPRHSPNVPREKQEESSSALQISSRKGMRARVLLLPRFMCCCSSASQMCFGECLSDGCRRPRLTPPRTIPTSARATGHAPQAHFSRPVPECLLLLTRLARRGRSSSDAACVLWCRRCAHLC